MRTLYAVRQVRFPAPVEKEHMRQPEWVSWGWAEGGLRKAYSRTGTTRVLVALSVG